MSCKCCCTNTLNLCNQNTCNGVDLGIAAQLPGAHQLKVYFLGTMQTLEEEFEVGEQVIFPLDPLNENFEFTGELYDPIGNRINISKNGVEYDCFKFRSMIGVTHSNVVLQSS